MDHGSNQSSAHKMRNYLLGSIFIIYYFLFSIQKARVLESSNSRLIPILILATSGMETLLGILIASDCV